jgi:hypothetical protein
VVSYIIFYNNNAEVILWRALTVSIFNTKSEGLKNGVLALNEQISNKPLPTFCAGKNYTGDSQELTAGL